ncbi:MAG: hypothetical protein ACREQT_17970 [Candidatus Binataceae bacterium]
MPSLQLGFLIAAATAAPMGAVGAGPSTDAQIMQQALKDSRDSLRDAIAKMDTLIEELKASKNPLGPIASETYTAVIVWLNVLPGSGKGPVSQLQSARDLMNRNLNLKTSKNTDPPLQRGGPILVQGSTTPTTNYHGNTPGDADRGTDCGDSFFNPDGPNCRRDVITHEFFHILGVHHGGGALDGPTIREKITTIDQALDSADNLAQLVARLTTLGGRTDACTRPNE